MEVTPEHTHPPESPAPVAHGGGGPATGVHSTVGGHSIVQQQPAESVGKCHLQTLAPEGGEPSEMRVKVESSVAGLEPKGRGKAGGRGRGSRGRSNLSQEETRARRSGHAAPLAIAVDGTTIGSPICGSHKLTVRPYFLSCLSGF